MPGDPVAGVCEAKPQAMLSRRPVCGLTHAGPCRLMNSLTVDGAREGTPAAVEISLVSPPRAGGPRSEGVADLPLPW